MWLKVTGSVLFGCTIIVLLLTTGTIHVRGIEEVKYRLALSANILRRWKCPGGGYAAGVQKSKVLCLKCPAGYFCLGGFKPKRRCPRGRYQSYEGQQFCFLSPPGTFVSKLGSRVAIKCGYGFYNPSAGQKECRPASPGNYVSMRGQTKQIPCGKNMYQPHSQQKACIPCPKGTTSGIGAIKCSEPSAGRVCRCPRLSRPICGKDGKTYLNFCSILCAKEKVECQGKCPCQKRLPEITLPPVREPCICPKVIVPVCGMDQKTYGNMCLAHCAGKIVSCNGKCPCSRTIPPEHRVTHRPTHRPTRRPTSRPQFQDIKKTIMNIPTTIKYFYVDQEMKWQSAREYCVRRGAQLAMIHSKEENNHVSRLCRSECWIGADRGDKEDQFGWTDESSMVYANWVSENEFESKERESGLCAQMNANHKWIGADCERNLPFVCQNTYDFQLKLSVDDTSAFDDEVFGGRSFGLKRLIVGAILLIAFICGQFMYSIMNDHKRTKDFIEKNEGLSEKTPLLRERVTFMA